jgi:copper chaperone NosL
MLNRLYILIIAFMLSACNEETLVNIPVPQELDGEANGYYCGMTVKNHTGPKAQIHLKGKAEPLWFVSVRDAIAFTLLPEEPKNVAAIYVTDMSIADWHHPELEMKNWIDAKQAFYVIDSNKNGGMGAAEAVPFLQRQDAVKFARVHNGQIITLADIPENYILGYQGTHPQ